MMGYNSRNSGLLLAIFVGMLLVVPVVVAFDVKLAFVESQDDYSGIYFTNGLWVIYQENSTSHMHSTRIVNASSGETVLTINDLLGSVVPVDEGYLLVSTVSKENSLRLYRLNGEKYTLVWKIDTSRYGWVSYILPVHEKNLILAGTVDASKENLGGHYIIGVDFGGKLKFATNLHVVGNTVSSILPAGNGKYLVVVPGFGKGLPYFGLIDESGNVLKSVRINYPVASIKIYIQDDKFVMASWRDKSEGYIPDIKTYYGIWTLNLTPVAIVELPYEFLGAVPIFDNNSLYLFMVKQLNSTCTLVESKYLLNGTLQWRRDVQSLKFSEPLKGYWMSTNSISTVLLPYHNVHVGVYPCGATVNVVAIDFRNAVPLASTYLPMGKGPNYYFAYYDAKYIYTGPKVYLIDTSWVPSAVLIDSIPPGNVTIDERHFGLTPLYTRLSAGRHEVRIVRGNYSPVERVLTIGPHEGIRLSVHLSPLNATLCLNSTPVAEVDIVPEGITVYTPAKVSLHNGTYILIFKSKEYPAQYGSVRKTVELSPNETAFINVELPLIRSELIVTSNVVNATVYVDGKPVGRSPVRVFVIPGFHNITVRANGYIMKSVVVNVTKPTLNVSVDLSPVVEPGTSPIKPLSNTTQILTSSTSKVNNNSSHLVCGPGLIVIFAVSVLIVRVRL